MSGISLKNKNFIDGMRLFEEDRKIDADFVLETLKEAIAKTYQKHIDAPAAEVRVEIEKNEMHVYHLLKVVDDEDDTFDETLDILLSEARNINPDCQIGDTVEEESISMKSVVLPSMLPNRCLSRRSKNMRSRESMMNTRTRSLISFLASPRQLKTSLYWLTSRIPSASC